MKDATNNKRSLINKFQKIDFLVPLMLGAFAVIFFYHEGVMRVGIALMILAAIVARLRWKFVYGSDNYKESVKKSYEISKSDRSGNILVKTKVYICFPIVIAITVYGIGIHIWYQNYLKALILFVVAMFFIAIFISTIRR